MTTKKEKEEKFKKIIREKKYYESGNFTYVNTNNKEKAIKEAIRKVMEEIELQ